MPTAEQLLDLAPSVGQRSSSFRFDLLDQSGSKIGELQPDDGRVPVVENNTAQAIPRSLRGLLLAPGDAAAINPESDRVRPVMVLETGDEFPWGLFVFVDGSTAPQSAGTWFSGSMLDRCWQLDQPCSTTTAFDKGTPIVEALEELFIERGVYDYEIDPLVVELGEPIAWPAGRRCLAAMNDLAALAGCFSIWFNNSGVGQVRAVPDLSTAPATRLYPLGGNIYDGSVLLTENWLSAPNRYTVIDSSAVDDPIVGVYDIPASAPHSEANRGFVVATVITEQGLGSVEAAEAVARAAAAQDANDFGWASFQSAPDPRHDSYDLVELLGVKYREQRWSCPLEEGSAMSHDLRRVY